jgi:hypothetical protein
VEDVGAEPPIGHRVVEAGLGRGDEAHVGAGRRRRRRGGELALLQHAHQLRLRRGRELVHVVEKERPAVGERRRFLCASRPRRSSSRSASTLAPATRLQLYSTNGFRARASCGAACRQEFLARSGFAYEQHRCARRRRACHQLAHQPHGFAVADDAREVVPAVQPVPQAAVLVGQPDPLAGAHAVGGHRRPDELREMFQQHRHVLGRNRRLRRQVDGDRADGALARHDGH